MSYPKPGHPISRGSARCALLPELGCASIRTESFIPPRATRIGSAGTGRCASPRVVMSHRGLCEVLEPPPQLALLRTRPADALRGCEVCEGERGDGRAGWVVRYHCPWLAFYTIQSRPMNRWGGRWALSVGTGGDQCKECGPNLGFAQANNQTLCL